MMLFYVDFTFCQEEIKKINNAFKILNLKAKIMQSE